MILVGLLPTTDGMRIPVDVRETIANVIQYIININTSYLANQGVPEYLHNHVDKYRKQTSDVIIDKLQKESLQLGLDVGGILRLKSKSFA